MATEWKKVRLGDIATNIQTGPFGSQLHMSDYSEEGTPVVMPKDMINGKISESSIARVSENHVKRLNRYVVSTGNILYARRGDVGKCVYVSKKENGWLCGTGCLNVELNSDVVDSKFLFFQLQRPETVGWVEKNAVGATMLNLNTEILSRVPVSLPPLETQQKIAGILSAYDDLIENNRKQIKLLEEAAQKLYKEWFVKLNFPGHENVKIVDSVPEGWKKEKIGKLFKTVLGGTPSRQRKDFWEKGTIPWINSGKVNELRIIEPSEYITELALNNSATKLLPKHTVLIAITGATLGQVSYTEIETCANQSVVGIIDTEETYSSYLYFNIRTNIQSITAKATGGAQQHINKDIIDNHGIIIPSISIIELFNRTINPIFNRIAVLLKQNQLILAARNSLLPKIMNGDILQYLNSSY